jgi:hypothetical protein
MWGSNFRRIAGWPCRKVTESFISDEVNTFWVFTVPQTRQGLDRNLILQCFDVFCLKLKQWFTIFTVLFSFWPVQKFVARRCCSLFISFDQWNIQWKLDPWLFLTIFGLNVCKHGIKANAKCWQFHFVQQFSLHQAAFERCEDCGTWVLFGSLSLRLGFCITTCCLLFSQVSQAEFGQEEGL